MDSMSSECDKRTPLTSFPVRGAFMRRSHTLACLRVDLHRTHERPEVHDHSGEPVPHL